MIHLLDTELPSNKSVFIALTNIYGINISTSKIICKKLGFSNNLKSSELSKDQRSQIIKLIEILKIPCNLELKKLKILKRKKLVDIKHYRGLRQLKGFPVRGQRTRSNAKTAKKRKII